MSDESLFEFGFTHNRKIRKLSDAAFRLWVSAIDHANEDRTDGVITAAQIDLFPRAPKAGRERDAAIAELVLANLWHFQEQGRWIIHDFLEWQSSAAEREERRVRDRDRVRRARDGSRSRSANTITNSTDPDTPPDGDGSRSSSRSEHTNRDGNGGASGALPGFPPHPPSSPDQAQQIGTETRIPEDLPENEGSGRARAGRKTQLPRGWGPTPEHRQRAADLGLNFDRELERFRAHAEATGRRMQNWNATFTTWLLNADRFAGESGKQRQVIAPVVDTTEQAEARRKRAAEVEARARAARDGKPAAAGSQGAP